MKSLVLLSTFASMALAMCNHGTALNPRDGAVKPKFGYTGLEGPLAWHGLGVNHENIECATGKEQSPIDIIPSMVPAVLGRTLTVTIPQKRTGGHLENLGTTLEVEVNGTLVLNSKTYALKQFHFHTPSEHRIDGEHFPMEVHFVFQASDNALSVIGFPIEIATGSEKPLDLLKNVFLHAEEATLEEPAETGPLNFSQLLEHLKASQVYQYGGSLTTPPCDEKVAWNVVKKPILIDAALYKKAKQILKFNSRYTQNHAKQINLLDNARNILDAPL